MEERNHAQIPKPIEKNRGEVQQKAWIDFVRGVY